jgi:molybdopterin-containing oxidoreductase family membrane subunit
MSLTKYESTQREPLVDGEKTYHDVTVDICHTIEVKPTRLWYIGFYISVALLCFGAAVYREVTYGIGQWNLNRTVGWEMGYHQLRLVGGYRSRRTLISAILLLFRRDGEPV